MALNLTGRTKI